MICAFTDSERPNIDACRIFFFFNLCIYFFKRVKVFECHVIFSFSEFCLNLCLSHKSQEKKEKLGWGEQCQPMPPGLTSHVKSIEREECTRRNCVNK